MRFFSSKSIVIFLFCIVKLSYGANNTNQNSAIIFPNTNNINKSNSLGSLSTSTLTVDTKNDSILAKGGAKLQHQNLKIQASGFEKNSNTNTISTIGDVKIEVKDNDLRARIDSSKVLFSLDDNSIKYYDSVSYMEVGEVTGGMTPNDRIYFGGEVGEYHNNIFTLKKAWFTTDYHILDTYDYKQGGYYLQVENLKVVPDDKVEFKDIDLYIKNRRIGWFPWYAVNIRNGSKVPLFPEWGDNINYGFYITSGINYGSNDSKYFKGGIAPKFSDKLGFLIGRYENWHNFGKYGNGKISVDDFLVAKKNSSIDNRWDFNGNHQYKNNNGYLNLGLQSTTVNQISTLEDYRDDLEQSGYYNPTSSNYSGKYRDDGDTIDFITLNSDFKNLGERKDTSFNSKVKLLIGEQDTYKELVDNRMNDAAFEAQLDNKLFTVLDLKKDNKDYMFSSYYDYMKDLDIGSTSSPKDDQSKRENYGLSFNLKEAKINFDYNHKNGDKLRALRTWERSPDLEDITKLQGGSLNYVPWSVTQYDIDNNDEFNLSFGRYSVFNTGATYKIKLNSYESEQKLNLENDPFREASVSSNSHFNTRDQQYNRMENIIYNKTNEDKVSAEFLYKQYRLELSYGSTDEKIWDREGIYNYTDILENDSYNIYINNSNFVQSELEVKNLSLGSLGKARMLYNLRYDKYTGGYDPYFGSNKNNDSTLRHQFSFSHNVMLIDNTNNHFRTIDYKLRNKFDFFGQLYSYNASSNAKNAIYSEQIRLKNKDHINQFENTISLDIGNTTTIYSLGYKEINNSYDNNIKKGELYTNNIDFLINDQKKLNLYYSLDKRYTLGELSPTGYTFNNEYNDLTSNKFGGSYYFSDIFKVYYQYENIDTLLLENQDFLTANPNYNSKEMARENTYGVELKRDEDVYNITYTSASNRRKDDKLDSFSIKNDIFGVSYLNGGDTKHFYRGTYGIYKYGPSQNLKNFSLDQISFKYEYQDKSFTNEELRSYAASEYSKDSLEITPAEISRVRQILNKRNDNQLDFHLNSIMAESMNQPEYKKFFTISMMAKIHREAYNSSQDLWGSLKEIESNIYGSYKRYGLGYKYNEVASFDNSYNRNITKQEHEFRVRAGIGRPSQGWNVRASYKTEVDRDDEYGIYLGKEMGYYEWAIGYTKDYDRTSKNYEDRLAVQFTLLTFPENPLFGLGYKNKNGNISPKAWLGSGIEVDNPEDL